MKTEEGHKQDTKNSTGFCSTLNSKGRKDDRSLPSQFTHTHPEKKNSSSA